MIVGFLVNPVAGLGGAVGLKGTDGLMDEAIARGARPHALERARECISHIGDESDIRFLTCSSKMGADCLTTREYETVYKSREKTTANDTRLACETFLARGVEMILFCGGDGTARDVYSVVADKIPILGIPAGVKMHSSVFAVTPHAAAEVVNAMASGSVGFYDSEVMDVDEDAYRAGKLRTRIYGIAKTPHVKSLVQASKRVFVSADDDAAKSEIAAFAKEFMGDGSTYILGGGSTTAAIAKEIGVDKTLLGVDVVKDGKLILADASEKDLIKIVGGGGSVKIIVSPIGAQGFVFGRGTQQISPEVIRGVGVKNIILVSTPYKLNNTRNLLVDTGDPALDGELSGYRSVVIGYRLVQKKDITAG